jgi:hypothetical protein
MIVSEDLARPLGVAPSYLQADAAMHVAFRHPRDVLVAEDDVDAAGLEGTASDLGVRDRESVDRDELVRIHAKPV